MVSMRCNSGSSVTHPLYTSPKEPFPVQVCEGWLDAFMARGHTDPILLYIELLGIGQAVVLWFVPRSAKIQK
jgi:hypothetical protein